MLRKTLLTLALAGFALQVQAEAPVGSTGRGTANATLESMKFDPIGDVAVTNGPRRQVIFGNPASGPHGFMLRLPGKWESGFHFHNADYHAVVVDGTLVNNFEGQTKEIVLGRGGYFHTASNVNHTTRCISETPCIVYVQMNKAFDAVAPHKH